MPTTFVSVKAVTTAVMSVYNGQSHRIEGPVEPQNAAVLESLGVISPLLEELQKRGVVPGTVLKITIETLETETIDY